MSVISIEDTTIDGTNVTVTAIVEDMRLVRKASYFQPDEWSPGLCTAVFELDEDESIPTDQASFCSYLDQKDLLWELVDTSDWYLES